MDIEVVAFDVFGTLVDWHTSIATALAEVGARAGIKADWPEVANAWRALYHPTLNRVVEGGLPFQPLDVLHRMMLDQVADEHGLGALTSADRDELVRAWHRLRPWPDTVPGLTALRERHYLSPLSNGGLGLLTRLGRFAGLPFDCILSAELAGTYKPDPRVYAQVPQNYAPSIHIGTTATLTVPEYPNQQFSARVVASADSVSSGSGTTLVQLLVDNSNSKLMPGGFDPSSFSGGFSDLTKPRTASWYSGLVERRKPLATSRISRPRLLASLV